MTRHEHDREGVAVGRFWVAFRHPTGWNPWRPNRPPTMLWSMDRGQWCATRPVSAVSDSIRRLRLPGGFFPSATRFLLFIKYN